MNRWLARLLYGRRASEDSGLASVGQVRFKIRRGKGIRWASYVMDSNLIILRHSMKEKTAEDQFCTSVIGIDHEYLHHILTNFEGKDASAGLDTVAKSITDHCIFTGMNFTIRDDKGKLLYWPEYDDDA